MSSAQGRRLPDCPVNVFPIPFDDLQPGDYWRCQHPDGSHLLDVRANPDDRRFWGSPDDPRFDGNLTGGVWGVVDPLGHFGMLSIHTVREEDDGTISVRPGDGSSNSILIRRRDDEPAWHGYIEHGVWSEC
jgi:hypothetical protein